MKSVQPIASLMLILSRILSVVYFLLAFITGIAILLKPSFLRLDPDGRNFNVLYPLTHVTMVRGENSSFYITEMILIMVLYGFFFWLLGNVFSIFRKNRLFTLENIRHLELFYKGNFLVPFLFLAYHIVIRYELETTAFLAVLHAVLGTFTYFMTAIFKQGLHLQKEQDLFI